MSCQEEMKMLSVLKARMLDRTLNKTNRSLSDTENDLHNGEKSNTKYFNISFSITKDMLKV